MLKKKENAQIVTTAGIIIKCPACGEIVDTLMTKCPKCGTVLEHEPNKLLKEFTAKIEELENKKPIVEKVKRIFIKRDKYFGKHEFNNVETKKANYIKEFTISNDLPTIYEFLIYIKARLENEIAECNPKSKMWSEVWVTKAKEIKNKADLVTTNDSVIEQLMTDILNLEIKLKKLYSSKKRKTFFPELFHWFIRR